MTFLSGSLYSLDSEFDIDMDLAANEAMESLLPAKSKAVYEKTYKLFREWCTKKNVDEVNEKCILVYFNNKKLEKKTKHCMGNIFYVKTTINCNLNIDISNYNNLKAFLKRKSDGYCQNKAKTFSKNEIMSFLETADDNVWLHVKVALIVGILECCRKCESMYLKDIEDKGECVEIKVPDTKIVCYYKGKLSQYKLTSDFSQLC